MGQSLSGLQSVLWPEDLQSESGVNKTFDKLHIRNAPRILMGDARYREYSWYEEYRSKIIHIHGDFQKASRRLQQMNLGDTCRAEMTKEANNTLVSKIKQLKAHYGITVREAVCNICNQVD